MEKIRVKTFQHHWIDDVVLIPPAGVSVIAFALLAATVDAGKEVYQEEEQNNGNG